MIAGKPTTWFVESCTCTCLVWPPTTTTQHHRLQSITQCAHHSHHSYTNRWEARGRTYSCRIGSRSADFGLPAGSRLEAATIKRLCWAGTFRHSLRHSMCTYLMVPLHLQGEMRRPSSLSSSTPPRHILHCFASAGGASLASSGGSSACTSSTAGTRSPRLRSLLSSIKGAPSRSSLLPDPGTPSSFILSCCNTK